MLVTLEQRDVALRQSEAQVRALIEQAADGIFITDRAGLLIDVNASGARMLGSTRGELQGRELASLLVEEGRAEAQARQDRLARVPPCAARGRGGQGSVGHSGGALARRAFRDHR